MRVITFSTTFPKKHPRECEPTYFVEKIWAGLADRVSAFQIPKHYVDWDWNEYYNASPKWHTIRAGKRWKVDDFFSPRVWSGKPYASKQIQFAPPIEIKKIWDFEMDFNGVPEINGFYLEQDEHYDQFEQVAKNDGLSLDDFISWFDCHPKKNKEDKSFSGQILCWNEKINYDAQDSNQ